MTTTLPDERDLLYLDPHHLDVAVDNFPMQRCSVPTKSVSFATSTFIYPNHDPMNREEVSCLANEFLPTQWREVSRQQRKLSLHRPGSSQHQSVRVEQHTLGRF